MRPDSAPQGKKRERIIQNYIEHGQKRLAGVDKGHGFKSEGGEGGKAATESGRGQQPPAIMRMVGGPGQNVSHDERADHIDGQRAIRKPMTMGDTR